MGVKPECFEKVGSIFLFFFRIRIQDRLYWPCGTFHCMKILLSQGDGTFVLFISF